MHDKTKAELTKTETVLPNKEKSIHIMNEDTSIDKLLEDTSTSKSIEVIEESSLPTDVTETANQFKCCICQAEFDVSCQTINRSTKGFMMMMCTWKQF